MKINKFYIVLGLLIAVGSFFEIAAYADEANESTQITFSAPVQIPGQVLPAGTYTFRRANNDDLDLIQVFNADRTALLATVQTVSTDRMQTTGDTAITLAEPESGNPPLLVRWFYPGCLTGHEFVYSKEQEHEIAQARQETFVGSKSMPSSETAGE
jgi:hypothetical protein